MNFTLMIISLYRANEISFDADGSCDLSPVAVAEIEKCVFPMNIHNFWFEETLAFKVIKKAHEAIPVPVDYCRDLKQALRLH